MARHETLSPGTDRGSERYEILGFKLLALGPVDGQRDVRIDRYVSTAREETNMRDHSRFVRTFDKRLDQPCRLLRVVPERAVAQYVSKVFEKVYAAAIADHVRPGGTSPQADDPRRLAYRGRIAGSAKCHRRRNVRPTAQYPIVPRHLPFAQVPRSHDQQRNLCSRLKLVYLRGPHIR